MFMVALESYNGEYVGEPVRNVTVNQEGHLVVHLYNGKGRESTRVQSIEASYVRNEVDGRRSHNELVVTTRTSKYVFSVYGNDCSSCLERAYRLRDELVEFFNGACAEEDEPDEWWA